jgi:hypothetical protein
LSTHVVIRDLEVMEDVVAKYSFLEWDGWDVIQYRRKPSSFMNANAKFRNGAWHQADRYVPDYDGWHIPRSLVK